MKKIYLDYASSTPVNSDVLKKTKKIEKEYFANASSVHSLGRRSSFVLDQAREKVSRLIKSNFNEVYFTSCATESNNLAIQGLIKNYNRSIKCKKPHVITTSIEHHSVMNAIKELENTGLVEVTWLNPNLQGVINFEELKNAINENTFLISVMYVNNETGAIQPIRKIGKHINKLNIRREKDYLIKKTKKILEVKYSAYNKIYFHTDAVQAVNYLSVDVKYLHVDLMTISGHKMYAPKGCSVLYIKEDVPVDSIMQGGDQELSKRPGTYNLPSIYGFALACENIYRDDNVKKISNLKKYFITLLSLNCKIHLNSSDENCIPGIINLSVKGATSEILLLKLDQMGVCVSAGSACSAGAMSFSHVLKSMKLSEDIVNSSIRVSIGLNTKKFELKYLAKCLNKLSILNLN